MSHDLRVGEIQEKYITEHEIWQHLNNFYLQKSDKIATRFYLETMLIRNDYLSSNINEPFYFRTYQNTKLIDLYDYSIMNGYTTYGNQRRL